MGMNYTKTYTVVICINASRGRSFEGYCPCVPDSDTTISTTPDVRHSLPSIREV